MKGIIEAQICTYDFQQIPSIKIVWHVQLRILRQNYRLRETTTFTQIWTYARRTNFSESTTIHDYVYKSHTSENVNAFNSRSND